MQKAAALKLKRGDVVGWDPGDLRDLLHWAGVDNERSNPSCYGTVLHVTSNGGIRVKMKNKEAWIPYNWVSVVKRGGRPPPR